VTTKSEGQCKIDQVEAGELTIVALSLLAPQLMVKYALSNSETGARFGAGTMNSDWSPRTQELLAALITSVEQDIAEAVFSGGSTTTGSGSDDAGPLADVPGF
jgi:hypothetical protein